MKDEPSLKDKTIRNMIWSLIDRVGSRVIQLAMQLILARLLMPSDFGVLGIVTIFLTLPIIIIDSGFTNALIRDKDVEQKDYSTVFYYNVFISVVVYFLLFNTAGYISQFFEVPELVSIIRILGLVLIIESAGLIYKAILTKNLQFALQTKVNVLTSIFSGFIAIGFAVAGFGVWSLVFKILALQLSQTLAYVYLNRWKPSLVFSVSSFKRLFAFGWKLLVSWSLNESYKNIYVMIIGRFFPTAILGFYSNARNLSITATYTIAHSVEKVSYPVLSTVQDDDARLKHGFKKILKNSAFFTFPFSLGLVAISPALFRILLGENWLPSIPYFQILIFSGLFIPVSFINLNVLQVKGRSDLYLKVNIIEKVVGFAIVGLVLLFRLGIFGLLWGIVLHYAVSYFINSSYSKKMIDYGILEQLKDFVLILVISVFMGGITYSLNYVIIGNDWVLIFCQVAVGTLIYFALSYIFKLEELETVYQLAIPIKRRLLIKKA